MRDGSGPALRIFLALWPATAELSALSQLASRWQWAASARLTRSERLHLTLHFIGSVAQADVAGLRQLRVPWEGCEIVLDRAQVWPGGIAVVEAASVPRELQDLHEQLGWALRALGSPTGDRPYRPHVTLARKAQGSTPPRRFEPVRWHAGSSYVLVRTLPGGRGYEPLQRFG